MKDLIEALVEALQQNEFPFCKMTGAMQECLRTIVAHEGVSTAEFLDENGDWRAIVNNDFALNRSYRLRADYTEQAEDEYELCEIFKSDGIAFKGLLVYEAMLGSENVEVPISQAPDHPNFAGYLCEDGQVKSNPVAYRTDESVIGCVKYNNLKNKRWKPIRPTHVVFKK